MEEFRLDSLHSYAEDRNEESLTSLSPLGSLLFPINNVSNFRTLTRLMIRREEGPPPDHCSVDYIEVTLHVVAEAPGVKIAC